MAMSLASRLMIVGALCVCLSACGNNRNAAPTSTTAGASGSALDTIAERESTTRAGLAPSSTGETLLTAFSSNQTDQKVAVNRYLWNASLDVLSFLPVQTVDPFTGIIVTGFGTPPGGGRAYRATVHVTDPALEARALRVSLQTRNGPVATGTSRAVEDAILARARQLRIADNRF